MSSARRTVRNRTGKSRPVNAKGLVVLARVAKRKQPGWRRR